MGKWIKLGFLDESDCDFRQYRNNIGLYQAILNNHIVYIGKATEIYNGGYRKRLRDYTRDSNSARNYPSGLMMNQYQSELTIKILPLGNNDDITKIEKEAIKSIQPKWNKLDFQ